MEQYPEGVPAALVQESILDKFEIASDFSLLRAASLEESRRYVEELKEIGKKTDLIGRIDAVSEFIPDEATQQKNIGAIKAFSGVLFTMQPSKVFSDSLKNATVAELRRLHQNIVEIGELSITSNGEKNRILAKCDQIVGTTDESSRILAIAQQVSESDAGILGEYQFIVAGALRGGLSEMADTTIVTIENLPAEIKDRYVGPQSGEYLITVYPKGNIWDERILKTFDRHTRQVSEKITGMPAIMIMFIDLMVDKGRLAIILGALGVMAFLYLDFRSMRYTLLAMVPLAAGVSWMVGAMYLLDIKFSMSNFMAIPLILGIGIDDGVHILHRYRLEGRGSISRVIRFTGRAVFLTSLTTVFGFGSMALASHRGIASMGLVLSIGVTACFITSTVLLPALITLLEKFNLIHKGGRV